MYLTVRLPPFFYGLMLTIFNIQILSYALDIDSPGIWQTPAFESLFRILTCFHFGGLIEGHYQTWRLIFYAVLAILMIAVSFMLSIICKLDLKSKLKAN